MKVKFDKYSHNVGLWSNWENMFGLEFNFFKYHVFHSGSVKQGNNYIIVLSVDLYCSLESEI